MATRLNGKIVDENLVFGFDTGDGYNSYKGQPVENILALGGSDTEIERDGTAYPYYSINIDAYIQSRWTPTNNVLTLSYEGKRDYVGGGTGGGNDGYPVFYIYFTDWSWASTKGNGAYDWTYVQQTFTMPDPSTKSVRFAIYHMNSGNRGRSYSRKHMLSFGDHSVPFVNGTRTVTEGLLDLKNNVTLDLTNVSFNSTGKIIYDGTDDKIHAGWPGALNAADNTTPRTWEIVVKKTGGATGTGLFGHKAGPGCSYYCNGGIYQNNGRFYFNWYDNAAYRWLDSGISANTNEYYHVVGVFDTDRNPRIYVNGLLRNSYGSATQLDYSSGMAYYDIGFNSDGGGLYYFTGEIPVAKFYKNKALTDVEIYQNFLQYKSRFGMNNYQTGVAGGSESNYVTSLDMLVKSRAPVNGVYWFKPDPSQAAFEAYVDFDVPDVYAAPSKPWMHVGTIADKNEASNNSTNHPWSYNLNASQSSPPWDDNTTFGTTAARNTDDYKNLGWSTVPFTQIMIKDSGAAQRKLLITNEGQITSSNSSLSEWFGSLIWDALGSDTSSNAYSARRVKALDITTYGVSDPALQSSAKTKLLFKYGEKDGVQDGNKDRSMIAWHRHTSGDGVDGPSGLGCFTNRSGTIDYRDIVLGSVYGAGQDYPPVGNGGGSSYYYTIWIR